MRKHIQIGPSRYKLRTHKWGAKILEGHRGYCSDHNEIGIETRLPKDMEAEVLVHEILHAIYYTFNLGKMDGLADDDDATLEEGIVTTFSTALCTVFAQNPWLLPYLQKQLLHSG